MTDPSPTPVAFDPLSGGCPHCHWLDTNLGRILDRKCDLHQRIEDLQVDAGLTRQILNATTETLNAIRDVIGAHDETDPVAVARELMDELNEFRADVADDELPF